MSRHREVGVLHPVENNGANAANRLSGPFRHLGGYQWLAELPAEGTGHSDSGFAPAASTLALFENGVALGPRHSPHSDIEGQGGGRYSHWDGHLRFSSSDGSDPNHNGRQYSWTLVKPSIRVLGFGSCHLHQAIAKRHGRNGVHNLWPEAMTTYSVRETLQLLRHYSGREVLPQKFHPFTVTAKNKPDYAERIDLLFLEFGSSIDIAIGSIWLTRSDLISGLVDKLAALGPQFYRVAWRWYNQGLIRRSEAARQACVDQLLKALPMIETDHLLAREIITAARGKPQDAAEQLAGLEEIREIVRPRAVCIMSAQNTFMPDGRPLSWPGNYLKELDSLCQAASVSLLHPHQLVGKYGVSFSLSSDRKHYTDAFINVLADELFALGQRELIAHDAR